MELKLKSGTVNLNPSITGGQYQDIQDALVGSSEFSSSSDFKMSGDVLKKILKMKIEMIVKSVNGSEENIFEAVRNLERSDYLAVLEKIEEVYTGLSDQKKTE